MRHRVKGRRLSRPQAHRKALMINLAKSLIRHRHIRTTVAKAKELRRFIEPLVTRAKEDTLHNRRILLQRLGGDQKLVERLISEIGASFAERPGGYTRVLRLADRRDGDAAEMAIIEFVDYELPDAEMPDFDEDDENEEVAESESETQAESDADTEPASESEGDTEPEAESDTDESASADEAEATEEKKD